MKVLVVGGGVGGMCTAICLGRQGIEVDLVDLDPTWRAVGAGLTLNSASLRAFDMVGVLDEVRTDGDVHLGALIHNPAGEFLFASDDRDKEGRALMGGGILRPALHAILAKHTRVVGVKVSLGVTVDRLTQNGDHVSVVFSDGSTGDYDLVVGADGLQSKVRKLIFPDAPAPRFTGQGCWRAVFARPAWLERPMMYIDAFNKGGVNPVSDTEMYLYLVETVPNNPWYAPDDWPVLLRERMAPFRGLLADLRETVDEHSQVNYRPLETLLLPSPWYVGRVLLIGDAAHATTPQSGYGAGLAAEDGAVLGEILARGVTIEEALPQFMKRRFDRCKLVTNGSARLGEMETQHAPAEEHRALREHIAKAILEPI